MSSPIIFRWPHVERCLGKGSKVGSRLPLGRHKRVKGGTSGDKVTTKYLSLQLGIGRSAMIVGAHIETPGNTDVNALLSTMTSSMSATCAKR